MVNKQKIHDIDQVEDRIYARDLDETEAKVEELFQTLGCMDYD